MNYNDYYKKNKDVFGKDPEKILVDYTSLISREYRVLDIGAGQGRHTIFLSKQDFCVDAIDTSEESVLTLENIKREGDLPINTFTADYKNFAGEDRYSAVLLFGLLQILGWDEIEILKGKIFNWLKKDGLLFVTAFTISDDSHGKIISDSVKIGKNSYLKPNGDKRTYFESGEIKKIFDKYDILHYREGMGPEHRHGDGPVERHSLVEAVFRK